MLYGVFDKLKLEVRAATRAALPTLLNQQRRADERKRLGTLIPGRTAFVFSLPASWSFWAAVVSRVAASHRHFVHTISQTITRA